MRAAMADTERIFLSASASIRASRGGGSATRTLLGAAPLGARNLVVDCSCAAIGINSGTELNTTELL